MAKKARKELGEIFKQSERAWKFDMLLALTEDEFVREIKKHSKVSEQRLREVYQEQRTQLALDPQNLKYLQSIKAKIQKNPKDKYILYYPMFVVDKLETSGDLMAMQLKSLTDFKARIDGKDLTILKSAKMMYNVNILLKEMELCIYNSTNRKLYTKFTDFETVEHEKVVEKTKIVKQVVNKDKSNKLDKIKRKVEHVIDRSQLHEKVKQDILNCFK